MRVKFLNSVYDQQIGNKLVGEVADIPDDLAKRLGSSVTTDFDEPANDSKDTGAGDGDGAPATVVLTDLKVDQLKELAGKLGIDGVAKMKKDELIKAIMDKQQELSAAKGDA